MFEVKLGLIPCLIIYIPFSPSVELMSVLLISGSERLLSDNQRYLLNANQLSNSNQLKKCFTGVLADNFSLFIL